jgi:hypothetical protein
MVLLLAAPTAQRSGKEEGGRFLGSTRSFMLKRFSWGGLQKRSAQEKEEEEEDVEVVEFFSGATTSGTRWQI